MVGAIASGTMDVGSDFFFLSVFPREKTPRIHTVSARAAAGAADPPAGILLRWPVAATPHPRSLSPVGAATQQASSASSGRTGPGHEAPDASGSGRIRPRSPEIFFFERYRGESPPTIH